jgi:hypothetical protein
VEPKAGKHFTLATPNRSAPQFAQALETIITSYPGARTVHLIMDNLNIHGPKSLTDHFGKEKGEQLWSRLTVHYTPKHGSWLNQAEIEISLFARQCLGNRRIPTLTILQREAAAWNSRVNGERIQIDWQFTRINARHKFGYKPSKRNRFTRSERSSSTSRYDRENRKYQPTAMRMTSGSLCRHLKITGRDFVNLRRYQLLHSQLQHFQSRGYRGQRRGVAYKKPCSWSSPPLNRQTQQRAL